MSDSKLKTSESASTATGGDDQEFVDYYALLGVKKDATKTDIKKALVSFVGIGKIFTGKDKAYLYLFALFFCRFLLLHRFLSFPNY